MKYHNVLHNDLLCVGVGGGGWGCLCMFTWHGMCVEVKGPLAGVSVLIPLCESQE